MLFDATRSRECRRAPKSSHDPGRTRAAAPVRTAAANRSISRRVEVRRSNRWPGAAADARGSAGRLPGCVSVDSTHRRARGRRRDLNGRASAFRPFLEQQRFLLGRHESACPSCRGTSRSSCRTRSTRSTRRPRCGRPDTRTCRTRGRRSHARPGSGRRRPTRKPPRARRQTPSSRCSPGGCRARRRDPREYFLYSRQLRRCSYDG